MGKVFFKIKLGIIGIAALFLLATMNGKKNNWQIIKEKVEIGQKYSTLSEKVKNIGISFFGTPYVKNSLNVNSTEKLIIRFDSLDCMTFVENVVALSILSQQVTFNYKSYENTLKNLRYRYGQIDGYGSRIHYFLEWKKNLENRNIAVDFSEYFDGIAIKKDINYISANQNLYQPDSNKIVQIENLISQDFFYIPKDKFLAIESKLVDGDIIGFVAKRNNLDVVHMGFVFIQNNRPFLLHAPISRKVEVSKESLYEYLCRSENNIGIIVLHLQPPK